MIDTCGNTYKHYFALFIAPNIFEDSISYVDFIKFKEKLEIKNLSILDFITFLKHNNNFLEILYV